VRRPFVLLLVLAALPASPALAQQGTYNLFIAPMGEPFRAPVGKPYPSDQWFAKADANHDGAVTRDEFRADAVRFFKVLDVDGDGKIRDDEIVRYEKQMAPEIVANSFDTSNTQPVNASDDDNTLGKHTPLANVRQGAANFSFLGDPEPVRSADSDFNFKITPEEWQAAADRKFKLLDPNGTGALKYADLPLAPPQTAKINRQP